MLTFLEEIALSRKVNDKGANVKMIKHSGPHPDPYIFLKNRLNGFISVTNKKKELFSLWRYAFNLRLCRLHMNYAKSINS